jgi:hypothetical protein
MLLQSVNYLHITTHGVAVGYGINVPATFGLFIKHMYNKR